MSSGPSSGVGCLGVEGNCRQRTKEDSLRKDTKGMHFIREDVDERPLYEALPKRLLLGEIDGSSKGLGRPKCSSPDGMITDVRTVHKTVTTSGA